jgi:carboxypeptidase C (cathepsin A)
MEIVNMLYLDQPVQVGLSYDTLNHVENNLFTGEITLLNDTDPVPEQNSTLLVGTYPSQDSNNTALGTENAAFALWHFAQAWFQEFPYYKPNDDRVSIATESYGGRYGPGFTSFFERQNQRIEDGTWAGSEGEQYIINLDTLMIINGCIDRPTQWPSYPHIAFNNTYGIEAVNASIHEQMLDALYKPGGCLDMIADCRALIPDYDPENVGINATVNQICSDAENYCSDNVRGPYLEVSGRNYYDMATLDPDPFPAPFYQGFLNQPHVQAALGVPLNWTQSSGAVSDAFRSIGDYIRPGWIEDLAYLLDNGVKVTLAYGDRDYACNWIGGEAVSLAINYSGTDEFHSAGYAGIQANDSYVGGRVRQYGNLSFSRVYEAGHEIPSYQPETAYRIFTRALFNMDIATGTQSTYSGGEAYKSSGPADTWSFKNELPAQPLQFCYVLDPYSTCTEDQLLAVQNGTALVDHYIVVDKNSTQLFPQLLGASSTGSYNGTPSASATPSYVPSTGGAMVLNPSVIVVGVATLMLGLALWM